MSVFAALIITKKTKIKLSTFFWPSLFYQFITNQPGIVCLILEVIACKYYSFLKKIIFSMKNNFIFRKIAGVDYLLGNTRYECYNSDYNSYILPFMVPLLLIWVVLIPLLIFRAIKKHNKLQIKN